MKLQSVIAGAFCVAALFFLASCGGSGGGIDPVAAQQLLGGEPPTETSGVQDARAEALARRSDSLIATTLAYESQDGTEYLVIDPYCSGSTCTLRSGGLPLGSVDLATLVAQIGSVEGTPSQMILTKNGVSIQNSFAGNSRSLSSTLRHSIFGAGLVEIATQGDPIYSRAGIVAGDLSGSSPVVSGSWSGMMTGIHRRGDDLLLGDATIWFTVSGSGGSLSASFTNIQNVSRNVAYSVSRASFSGVRVSSDGTFRSGSSGNRIQGGFYGYGHPEATGVFEQSGMLGSFGAYRQ